VISATAARLGPMSHRVSALNRSHATTAEVPGMTAGRCRPPPQRSGDPPMSTRVLAARKGRVPRPTAGGPPRTGRCLLRLQRLQGRLLRRSIRCHPTVDRRSNLLPLAIGRTPRPIRESRPAYGPRSRPELGQCQLGPRAGWTMWGPGWRQVACRPRGSRTGWARRSESELERYRFGLTLVWTMSSLEYGQMTCGRGREGRSVAVGTVEGDRSASNPGQLLDRPSSRTWRCQAEARPREGRFRGRLVAGGREEGSLVRR
jgi:hypothetical protein